MCLCSTPFGIKEVRTIMQKPTLITGEVLNAFRHQRSSDGQRSTQNPSATFVLNAFRHQRSSDPAEQCDYLTIRQCSTPFGIKEVRTTVAPNVDPNRACAQRLSASKKFGLEGLRCRGNGGVVLNAFRHQRSSDGCSEFLLFG